MLGKNVGFHAKVKSLNTGPITFTYSIIHREALASKKISAELCVVLQDAEKIINYIKSRALNSRLFSNLCKEMDSEFSSLLLHTEVRWLSRGKVLKRLIVLKDEVIQFLSESNSDLLKYFQDFFFVCHIYPPFTRKRIVSLYFGREVRTRLGVAFFKIYGPPVFHINVGRPVKCLAQGHNKRTCRLVFHNLP